MTRVIEMSASEGLEVDVEQDTAFEASLTELALPAYRLAFGMLQERTEAEDAVQEAALRAWRKRRTFREGASLRPWFLAIVANQCRSMRRNRWWRLLRQAEPEQAPVGSRNEEAVLDLRRALQHLDHDQRLVIVLRYYMDLDYDDIAATLGISEAAARSRTHRAIRRLRPELLP